MKFLIVSQYFPPEVGAAQTRLGLLARELVRQGHSVEVVTAFPNYPEGKIRDGYRGFSQSADWEGIRVHRFWLYAANGKGLGRLLNYLSFMITCLGGLFKVERPDWILVNTGPLFMMIPGWIYSVVKRAPINLMVADLWPRSVQHLQGLGMRLGIRLAESLEAWAYHASFRVSAVTEGIRKVLIEEKGVPSGKVLFLPNAIDLNIQETETKTGNLCRKLDIHGKFVLVYPGNHGHAHALHRVLETAQILREKAPDVRFLLVGGGSDKERLQKLASEMKLTNVIFAGPVPAVELPDWIALADVGLVHLRDTPLAEETRPAKLSPLMAQGKGIVYCGHGEGARLINESGGGWVVTPEQPALLAEVIIDLIRKPDEIAMRGQKSRAYAVSHFGIDRVAGDWLRTLPEVRR